MKAWLALIVILTLGVVTTTSARAGKSAAELEKEKALANPYPNDFGPDALDGETLKSYPANAREGYKLLLGIGAKKNCQTCHTAARPLNSRFVEPDAGMDLQDKEARTKTKAAAVAKLKKEHPEYFSDGSIWQIEPEIWSRYVKRMMSKPGCGISNDDGRKIWEFLVYDGWHRKIGAGAAKWKAHRQELINELKTKKPARYEELAKDKDL